MNFVNLCLKGNSHLRFMYYTLYIKEVLYVKEDLFISENSFKGDQ